MNLIQQLWRDEGGAVLSAEVVLVGTVAVLGSVVGLNMASTAVNEELKEMAFAIRSLDQSYAFSGHQSCCAWTAGSYYTQQDVQQSLSELCGVGAPDLAAIRQQIDAERLPAAVPPAPASPEPDQPPPNQLPERTK